MEGKVECRGRNHFSEGIKDKSTLMSLAAQVKAGISPLGTAKYL